MWKTFTKPKTSNRPILTWRAETRGWKACLTGQDPDHIATVDDLRDAALEGNVPVRIGTLLRLQEEGTISTTPDIGLVIPHQVVSDFKPAELRGLGFPLPLGHTIQIELSDSFDNGGASFRIRLLDRKGIRQHMKSRMGCMVRVGSHDYVLSNPLYPLIEGVESFNEKRMGTTTDRLEAWADLSKHLPGTVKLDPYLEKIRITRFDSIGLEPFRGSDNALDLNPVLKNREFGVDSTEDDDPTYRDALDENQHRSFQKVFRDRSRAVRHYRLDDGSYAFADGDVYQVLEVVKAVQNSDADTRRRFLINPRAVISQYLGETMSAEDLEYIIDDEGLSERVRDIGVWDPIILPWMKAGKEPWLPEELGGVVIDGAPLELTAAQATEAADCVEKAIKEGESIVQFRGRSIPATQGSLKSLRDVAERLSKDESRAKAEEKEDLIEDKPKNKVLLIEENILETSHTAQARRATSVDHVIPKGLRSILLSHQEEALIWLQERWASGYRGALLADDMGLGKTLVSIAFFHWLLFQERPGESEKASLLIVAPTGLIPVWIAESEKHLEGPGLGIPLVAKGPQLQSLRTSTKKESKSGWPSLDLDKLRAADWVLTSYETLRDYQHSFGRVRWSVLVMDEVQKIKNPGAGVSHAAKAMNSDFSLALTGTPVENRLADLWSIVDALQPGFLPSLNEFARTYEPTKGAPPDSAKLKELRRSLTEDNKPPLMIRRLKEDHLAGLPKRSIETYTITMSPTQAEAYDAVVGTARKREYGGGMLEAIQHMRRVSLHPGSLADYADDESFITDSARLTSTLDICNSIRGKNEKVLLFIDSREMQDALIEILPRRFPDLATPLLINGSMPGEARQKIVNRFQKRSGFDIMLISPRAGGVGLTITEANHVVHLSRWWNPAVEDQCNDRVYRIGQERDVIVHYPLALHPVHGDQSFDAKLNRLMRHKRDLSRQVLIPTRFTNAELESLL